MQDTQTQTTAVCRVAIAGNPNAGKTSLFNELTGRNQSVGNYPGVTVERTEGHLHIEGQSMQLIDLPGTYSLTAYSAEELVARNFIIDEQPEVVVDVVDASNLERNLYLTVQLMEMESPLVIALNMMDVAQRHGVIIDAAKMSDLLNMPVVETVAREGKGKVSLAQACVQMAAGRCQSACAVTYGHHLDEHIDTLAARLAEDDGVCRMYRPRWVAIKLIEKDPELAQAIAKIADDADGIAMATRAAIQAIETHGGDQAESIVAEGRYGFVAGIIRRCVHTPSTERRSLTDRVDTVVCHRAFGLVLLGAIVYSLFAAVFKISDDWAWLFGDSPTGWVGRIFDGLAGLVGGLEATSPMLHSLLADGVIGGVGGVMGFVPLIFTMFFFVAILEDTGYIARVAFVLDRALRAFGLQGRSILAMIVSGGLGGGGCAVPGVMATRTLRDPRDRLITMMVAPLMNCGAKIPVYLMLIAAFFAQYQAMAMFCLWLLSWAIALICSWVLRRFVIKGEQTPFVMELPSYHMPTLRGVMRHAWGRTWTYIRKAGTIILAVSLVMWALMFFPRMDESAPAKHAGVSSVPHGGISQPADHAQCRTQLQQSYAGKMGTALLPLTEWAGFDWRDNVALVAGFAAKEVIIGTLGVAYSMGQVDPEGSEGLSEQLAGDETWSPLKALAMLIFVMVYAPCMSTLAVIRRESGSWKWACFSTTYTTVLALVLAIGVYQVGQAFGLGT